MPSKLLKIQEPQPPPSVRIKLFGLEMTGTGDPGIRALKFHVIFLTVTLIIAAILMHDGFPALFWGLAETLWHLARSRPWS